MDQRNITAIEDDAFQIKRRVLLASLPLAAASAVWPVSNAAAAAESPSSTADRFALDSAPVLQNPTPDGMTIAWAVNGLATGWVEYGSNPNELTQRAISSQHGLVAMDNRFLSARITGLAAGQQVFYRVVSAPIDFRNAYEIHRGDAATSAVHHFTTPDARADTATFSVINDTHENPRTLGALTRLLEENPEEFVVWNGDVFNDIRNQDQIVAQVLRPAGAAYAAKRPVLFTSGNHDVRGVEARSLSSAFTPWLNEEPLGRCFAVRHGPLAIIGLDTGEDKPDVRPVFAGLADFERYRRDQRDWLAAALRRDEIAAAPFLVVCCHIPLNGLPGQNGGDTDQDAAIYSKQSRDSWGPLLNDAGAQLVISGHTHRHRYDAPTADRKWGQLIGGGPDPSHATLMRARATRDELNVVMHNLEGDVIGEWTFKPRSV